MEDLRKNFASLQAELSNSHHNLLPLADHVQASYAACKTADQRSEAFRTAKTYVTQALASVAYQVNETASLLEQLLGGQEDQVKALTVQVSLPRQVSDIHFQITILNVCDESAHFVGSSSANDCFQLLHVFNPNSKSVCIWNTLDGKKSPHLPWLGRMPKGKKSPRLPLCQTLSRTLANRLLSTCLTTPVTAFASLKSTSSRRRPSSVATSAATPLSPQP
jgi:hypothetical protein